MKTQFQLVYDGPALSESQMDVRTLAPALIALGDLVERANEMVNGNQARVALNVRGSFKRGSFGIEFELVTNLWQKVLDFTGNPHVSGAKEIIEWLGFGAVGTAAVYGSLVRVIRWLRGRGVKREVVLGNGVVRLYVGDEYIDVEEQVIALLRDYRIRKHLEAVIAEPLSRDGITVAGIVDPERGEVVILAEADEARWFKAPPAEEEAVADDRYEATLQVHTLAFQDGNKWRFGDGASVFFAAVEDEDFLARVARNQESFSKDDIIRARVRRVQRLTASGLKAEHFVEKVLEHRSASPHVQLKMSFGDSGKP